MSDKPEWHLKREVNISHILTTLGVAVSMAYWLFSVEARVDKNELRIENESRNLSLKIESIKEAESIALKSIERRLIRIENKLDRQQ